MKKFAIVLFFIGIGLYVAPYANAATVVSGDITFDTVWTAVESPYVVESDVAVLPGVSLGMESGVVVKFAHRAYLEVYGALFVNGTNIDPVYLTSLADDSRGGDTNSDGTSTLPSPFDLGGVTIYGVATSSITHAVVTYSEGFYADVADVMFSDVQIMHTRYGIIANESKLVLSRVYVKDTIGEALSVYGGSDVTVFDSYFRDIFDGDAISLYDASILIMRDSTVENIGDDSALGMYGMSIADVRASTFRGGLDEGIELYDGSEVVFTDVLVTEFPTSGLSVYDSTLFFDSGTIAYNGTGIQWYGEGDVIIVGSTIVGNADYGVYGGGATVFDARHNWWGDITGPYHNALNPDGLGDIVYGSVLLDPWLEEDPFAAAACCSSVLFIPGLQATRLELDDNRLWEPNRDADVKKLYMDENGNSLVDGIETAGIIDEAFGFNIYKSFIGFMDTLAADDVIEEWRALPYDWRFGTDEVVDTEAMAEAVEELAGSSKSGKVTIITHSNGGLVGKVLLSELKEAGTADLVDKLVMVAAPQLGTPKAIAGLLHGDEQNIGWGAILQKKTARGLAENMPAAYGLLPSEEYFRRVESPVVEFSEDVSEIYDFRSLYGEDIDNFEELRKFLLGDDGARQDPAFDDKDSPNVLNAGMLEDAQRLHNGLLDAWQAPEDVRVIQIAGWGLDTIRGIRYDDCDIPFCPDNLSNLDRELLMALDGDGTVVSPSAEALGGETYYLNVNEYNDSRLFNRSHADILEVLELHDLIEDIIQEDVITLPEFISLVKPIPEDEDKRLRISVHSPVFLHIYDSESNHTGLRKNQDSESGLLFIDEEIPNSYYLEAGEGKYIGADTKDTYRLEIVGEGLGSFTLKLNEVSGDGSTKQIVYEDIPVDEGTVVSISIRTLEERGNLEIDTDGNGSVDISVDSSGEIPPEVRLQILQDIVRGMEIGFISKRIILADIAAARGLAEKKRYFLANSVLQTLQFKLKFFGGKSMSREDANLLIDIVEKIRNKLVE